jgi:speckle-type POZ protein
MGGRGQGRGRLLGEERNTNYMVECQGQQFPCHRAILAARSTTFANGLASGHREDVQNRWVVEDAEPAAVKAMLAFIYTGDNTEAVGVTPTELLDLANKYHLPGLADASREAVLAELTPENAVRSLVELDRSGILLLTINF